MYAMSIHNYQICKYQETQVDFELGCTRRSGVKSQTQEILHFPGVSEIGFFKEPHKRSEELTTG